MYTSKGLSLFGVIVVIAVLAILAGVAVPKFMRSTQQTTDVAEPESGHG